MSANASAGPGQDGPTPPPFSFTTDPSVAKFAVPMRQYLDANPQFDGLCVGAFVFDNVDRILLIQRAAHDSMPSRWEVPGGACDFEDEAVLVSVARELWEESGLTARRMGKLVRFGKEEGVIFSRRQRRYCKYSFEVEVHEEQEVKLDPNEHQVFVWATEEQCRAGKVGETEIRFTTRAQKDSIFEGFRMRKEDKE